MTVGHSPERQTFPDSEEQQWQPSLLEVCRPQSKRVHLGPCEGLCTAQWQWALRAAWGLQAAEGSCSKDSHQLQRAHSEHRSAARKAVVAVLNGFWHKAWKMNFRKIKQSRSSLVPRMSPPSAAPSWPSDCLQEAGAGRGGGAFSVLPARRPASLHGVLVVGRPPPEGIISPFPIPLVFEEQEDSSDSTGGGSLP